MLKTIFSEDENIRHHSKNEKWEVANKIRIAKSVKKPDLPVDDLTEILFELQSTARDFDAGSDRRILAASLSSIKKGDYVEVAKILNILIRMAISSGPYFLGKRSMYLDVFIKDSCKILQERASEWLRFFKDCPQGSQKKKTQLRKICDSINRNLEEKRRIYDTSSVFFQSNMEKSTIRSGKTHLKALNNLLASTMIGSPFEVNGVKIFPLEREGEKRSVLFLNELDSLRWNKHQDCSLPVVAIPGTVILKRPQNKMVTRHRFLTYSTPLRGINYSQMCVDPLESNSRFSKPQVAPYIGSHRYTGSELHGAHTDNRKPETVARVEKILSEKKCCGFVMQSESGVIGLEICSNPNDFKALSGPYAEFLCGPYNFHEMEGEDINFSIGKKNLVIPWEKPSGADCAAMRKRDNFLQQLKEEHGLQSLPEIFSNGKETAVFSIQSASLQKDKPIHIKVNFKSGKTYRSRTYPHRRRYQPESLQDLRRRDSYRVQIEQTQQYNLGLGEWNE